MMQNLVARKQCKVIWYLELFGFILSLFSKLRKTSNRNKNFCPLKMAINENHDEKKCRIFLIIETIETGSSHGSEFMTLLHVTIGIMLRLLQTVLFE